MFNVSALMLDDALVQQQGGHIEHLMQKLQDVTVTLDNN